MKNLIRGLTFALITASCVVAAADTYSAQQEKVKKLFQSNEEPTAKDAVWTAKRIFKVGVIPDESSRDGYASYVCQVLYENGFRGSKVWVQVIDIVQLARNGKWIKLGEARCL